MKANPRCLVRQLCCSRPACRSPSARFSGYSPRSRLAFSTKPATCCERDWRHRLGYRWMTPARGIRWRTASEHRSAMTGSPPPSRGQALVRHAVIEDGSGHRKARGGGREATVSPPASSRDVIRRRKPGGHRPRCFTPSSLHHNDIRCSAGKSSRPTCLTRADIRVVHVTAIAVRRDRRGMG
jgi:hypothetical protein